MKLLLQKVHVEASLHCAQFEGQPVQVSGAAKKYPLSHSLQVVADESGQSLQLATVQVSSIRFMNR
jgi:hypothetical protein